MKIFTIYDHPRDYPDNFVVRGFDISDTGPAPDLNCTLANTLEEARKAIPSGLINVGRFSDDDAAILEVWI